MFQNITTSTPLQNTIDSKVLNWGTGTKATQSKIFEQTEVMLLPDPFQMGLAIGGYRWDGVEAYPLHPSITPLLSRCTEVEKYCQLGQSRAD